MSATIGHVTWSAPAICWDNEDFTEVVMVEDISDCDPAQVLTAVNELRELDSMGLKRSNLGGWHSPDITPKQSKPFVPLLAALRGPLGRYVERFGGGKLVLNTVNMWAIVSPTGASNAWHDHAGNFISGVYYVQVDDASSNLKFRNRYGHTYEIAPKLGRVVLFPSWMNHCVDQNKSTVDRVVVSFNLVPA